MKELEKSPATAVILMHLPSSDKERWSSAGERVEEGERMEEGGGWRRMERMEEGEKLREGNNKEIDNRCGRSEHIGNLHTLQTE